jgi:hypothetical protein
MMFLGGEHLNSILSIPCFVLLTSAIATALQKKYELKVSTERIKWYLYKSFHQLKLPGRVGYYFTDYGTEIMSEKNINDGYKSEQKYISVVLY